MSEMIHFINQYQYFIQCEILEPNWTELIDFIEHKANDLDQVITEHQNILQKIQSQIGLYDYDPMVIWLVS
jgi:gamma-tubulin complex component 3